MMMMISQNDNIQDLLIKTLCIHHYFHEAGAKICASNFKEKQTLVDNNKKEINE